MFILIELKRVVDIGWHVDEPFSAAPKRERGADASKYASVPVMKLNVVNFDVEPRDLVSRIARPTCVSILPCFSKSMATKTRSDRGMGGVGCGVFLGCPYLV